MDLTSLDLMDLGKQAYVQDNFEEARRYFQEVLKQGKKYADLLNMMGVIQHQHGEYNKAIQSFKGALKINPDYVEPRMNLAVLYNDLGNYAAARKLYAKKPKTKASGQPLIDGKLANQHASMGNIYRMLGRFDDAVNEYQKSLKLGPHYADIRTRMALALHEGGDTQAALRELRRALKDQPKFLEARVQLGVILFEQGKKAAARKEWQAVLKQDRQHPKAKLYLELI